MEALKALWMGADVGDIETREITVSRTFRDFDDLWSTSTLGTNVRATIAGMSADEIELLKSRVHTHVSSDGSGSITCSAMLGLLIVAGAMAVVSTHRGSSTELAGARGRRRCPSH